jgi:hypothetical protein
MINLALMKKFIQGDRGQIIMKDGSEAEKCWRRKAEFLIGL